MTSSLRWITGFLDSPSRAAESFWQSVTGFGLSARRGPEGQFATLTCAGADAYLRVQVVDSPPWSHLDLHVGDVRAEARRVAGLGASVVSDEGSLVVLRSPVGLLFCLVPWEGEAVRPPVPAWGARVDQVCLNVPVAAFEAEASFWVGVTGWERRAEDSPEFESLVRGAGLPLRLSGSGFW
mgnify:CR=1 FL=1